MLIRFILLITFTFFPLAAAQSEAFRTVGFEHTQLPDGTDIGIWFPTSDGIPSQQTFGVYQQQTVLDAKPTEGQHALVVMSHGNGSSFSGHLDTAVALAKSGFVVAALTHKGDNYQDQSRAAAVEDRPVALSALISFMLDQWAYRGMIDPAHIGAFGYSAGGFTVLAAAGGRPDLSQMAAHCAAHPDFFDCKLVDAHPREAGVWPQLRDRRIKALVVAAPALGFAFDAPGLKDVTMPVQLWRADEDQVLPAPFYADAVRAALPRPAEFHAVPGAGHLDFLAPCAPNAPPVAICQSAPGFNRSAFHEDFNARVVVFFTRTIGLPVLPARQ